MADIDNFGVDIKRRPYCQDCTNLKLEVEEYTAYTGNMEYIVTTGIRCIHEDACRRVYAHGKAMKLRGEI